MGVPGLAACTTKYQVTRSSDGKVIKNNNTIDHWSAAKKNLASTTRSTTFSSNRLGSPTKMYATGADSRLGKYGLEKGPDGRIRSNQNYSAWRTHSSSVIKPTVINTGNASTSSCNSSNFANDLVGVMTAATNLYATLNEVGAIGGKTKVTASSSNADGAGSVSKSVKQGPTAGMENAKDSATLQAAIMEAKADLSEVPAKLSKAEGEVKELSAKTDDLKQAADKAQGDYDKNLDDIKTQSGKVNEFKTSVKSSFVSYNSAKMIYEGTPNEPAALKAQAKERMDQQQKLYERAEAQLEKAEADLKELQGKTEGLKQAAGDAKDAYDTNVKTLETKEQEVKDLGKQKSKLEKEIPKQEKRLADLQKSEDKDLKELDKDINKYETEQKKTSSKDIEKYDKIEKKIKELRQKKADLQDTIAMRNLPVTSKAGGNCFQAGKINGEDVYMVGGAKVSKEKYDELFDLATKNASAA